MTNHDECIQPVPTRDAATAFFDSVDACYAQPGDPFLVSVNEIRDQLIVMNPSAAETIRTRDDVVNDYCKARGITKDEITSIEQILEIRALPEWINASA